jgi:phage-related protein
MRSVTPCTSRRPARSMNRPSACTASRFGSAGVLEIVEDWRGNTYRAVYTVRFVAAVVVLHVFQKKAKSGAATPKQDMDLIRQRLTAAEQFVKEQ